MANLLWNISQSQLQRRGVAQDAVIDILNTDFDAFPVSDPITIEDYRTAMGMTSGGGSSTVARTAIVSEAGRGNIIRQHFHAGQYGTADGISVNAPLIMAVDEATITFDVRFTGGGFDWGWGGKLPGLAGIRPGYGSPPSGGAPSPYGWSCRGMWITPGSYPGSSSVPNEWVGYMYDPTQLPGNYGQNHQTNVSFVADQWHTVRQYYKMNTVNVEGVSGNADGIHLMWLDDVLVYSNYTQVYRIYEEARITHLMWSMFYGGSTVDWAPAIDTDIDIDNLLISTPVWSN